MKNSRNLKRPNPMILLWGIIIGAIGGGVAGWTIDAIVDGLAGEIMMSVCAGGGCAVGYGMAWIRWRRQLKAWDADSSEQRTESTGEGRSTSRPED